MENATLERATGRTVKGAKAQFARNSEEVRALGVDTASAGGVLATDDFVDRLNVVRAPVQLPINRQFPEKGTATIPTVNTLPTLSLEGFDDASTDGSVTFSSVEIDDAVRRELFVIVSEQLMRDAEALEQKLLEVAGPAFAASTNELALTGSGSGQVLGVTNDTDVETQAIDNTDVGTIWDSIHQAAEKIGDGFRAGASLAVAMGGAEYRTLRNLKDSNNQPVDLFEFRSFGGGVVPYIGPFRVVIDGNTPNGELVFGHWGAGYEWAQVEQLTLRVARSEGKYLENFQQAIRIHDIVDGEPAQADAFCRATGLTTS